MGDRGLPEEQSRSLQQLSFLEIGDPIHQEFRSEAASPLRITCLLDELHDGYVVLQDLELEQRRLIVWCIPREDSSGSDLAYLLQQGDHPALLRFGEKGCPQLLDRE